MEIEDHPPTHELGTSPPGRAFASSDGRRSAMSESNLHELAEERFLASAAAELARQTRAQPIERLLLVAPAKALGFLRKHLDPSVDEVLSGEVAKDLAHLPVWEIERHLTP
ncbi:host attachment family protein [Rhizobium sullae]|uniref:host attachment family protein n=1 Tax=Rhizobium sullae TaxID=50338 RepID=UPI00288A34FE|nr:host attachment family protein [Rhizobium sullae]